MKKIIYEYSLDKIFVKETVETYNQFDGSLILPQFYTEIKPIFDSSTHFAIFNEDKQKWEYKEFVDTGIYYNKKNLNEIEIKNKYDANYSLELYTKIKPLVNFNDGTIQKFNEQLQCWEYIEKGSELLALELEDLKKKKIAEIKNDYEKSQEVLLKNGKSVLIKVMGQEYADLQREFNKSSWEKDKLTDLVIKDLNDKKRYKLTVPRSFGKLLLSKIQKISAKNYKKKEVFIQKIEREELSLEELSFLKIDFIFNSEININTEADNYISDPYYKAKYPEDVDFVIKSNKHFFTELNAE
jgi:hypothetical protein